MAQVDARPNDPGEGHVYGARVLLPCESAKVNKTDGRVT